MYTPNSSCSLLFENSKQFLEDLLINFFNIRRVLQQTVYGKLQTFPIIHCQDSAAPYIGSGPKEIDIKEGCTFFNLWTSGSTNTQLNTSIYSYMWF